MEENAERTKGRVLVTGGSGFIASHVIDVFLDSGFEVVTTARSNEKGRRIVESVRLAQQKWLSYVVLEDIAKEGAIDSILKTESPFEYVIHTAMPYHLNVQDPVKDFLDPAIKGTTGLLKSVQTYAPSVKRVVITSSSAAILNPLNHAKVYDETHWAPWTWEDALDPQKTYISSKVLSEKAAWAFMETETPTFDLVTINGTFTYGPIQRSLPNLDAVNTSNHRIRDLCLGKYKTNPLPPTAPVFTFVDVRDVARAHLKAAIVPEAGGNRFYVVGGHFSNKRVSDIIRKTFPELAGRLPVGVVDDFPAEVYGFDNGRSREVLGLGYFGLEESVGDTVRSMMDLGLGL